MVFSWAPTMDLVPVAVAKGATRLDELIGALRTGEIRWSAYEGVDAERFLAGEERTCQSSLERSNLDQVRAHFADRGGVVIVVTAPGEVL